MTATDWMILLLVIAPAIPFITLVILVSRRVWRTDSPSLKERAILALRDWLVASIAAALALTRLGFHVVPAGFGIPLLLVAMLLVSLPSLYWLQLYWSGSFRRSSE